MASNKAMIPRLAAAIGVAGAVFLLAQDPSDTVFREFITNVVAPTIVVDENDRIVNGLQPHDFVLKDNDKLQDIKVDVAFQPIDVVLVLQADGVTEEVLPRVKKLGPLLENLVIGEQGTVAIIAFDHRIRVMQDFTSDGVKIKAGLEKINAGSSSARQWDAVNEAARMLSHRDKNRRRIILLIAETRDKGSEGRGRETLLQVEINNIQVYTLNMSRFVNTLLAKTPVPRPDPIPPSARHMPAGGAATPTTMQQYQGTGNVLPAFVEVFRQVKAVFISNPAEVLTKFTGGAEFGFVSQKALEEAVSRIGEELHSQYLLSYNPNNKLEGGWHAIKVEVRKPGLKVRTRPGYWLAGVPQ